MFQGYVGTTGDKLHFKCCGLEVQIDSFDIYFAHNVFTLRSVSQWMPVLCIPVNTAIYIIYFNPIIGSSHSTALTRITNRAGNTWPSECYLN